jgi:NAD(P)-dependent dehydrogenase (short-subunit alcohol dehydrogenase family)
VREEFAGKTTLIVGGSNAMRKTVGRILLEGGAEAVIIVGKNERKLPTADFGVSFVWESDHGQRGHCRS